MVFSGAHIHRGEDLVGYSTGRGREILTSFQGRLHIFFDDVGGSVPGFSELEQLCGVCWDGGDVFVGIPISDDFEDDYVGVDTLRLYNCMALW